ncbi:MAG: LEA type 2 family protein [Bernardetiaceae bacterium]|nr:LEA type 2 family protein [Bernardetiaceae bacterium]
MEKYTFARISLCFLSMIALLSSCSVKEPEVRSVESLMIRSVSEKHIGGDIAVVLYHPNSFDAKIRAAQIEIFCEGKKLGTGTMDHPTTLKAEDTARVSFLTEWNLENLIELIANNSQEKLKIEGTYTINTPFKEIEFKRTHTPDIDWRALLQKQLGKLIAEHIKMQKVRSTGGDSEFLYWEAALKIKNPIAQKIEIQEIDMDFAISKNGRGLGNWKTREAFTLEANEERMIKTDIKAQQKIILKEFGRAFFGGSLDKIYTKGQLKLLINKQSLEIPIQAEFPIDLKEMLSQRPEGEQ